jgi:diguanylate cyclase
MSIGLKIAMFFHFLVPRRKFAMPIALSATLENELHQIEKQIANSAFLRAIHEQFIVSIADSNGLIIEANQALCDISKYTLEELIGQHHDIFRSGVHDQTFFDAISLVTTTGKSWRGDICNRDKFGDVYWVDCIIVPLLAADGSIERYASIRTEITARKLQEEALLRSQWLLEQTSEVASVGGWELEIETGKLIWSDETRRIHGVTSGFQPELVTAINFYSPESRPLIGNAVTMAVTTGQSWNLELFLIRADGKKIPVRARGQAQWKNGKPYKLLGTFQDITEAYTQRQATALVNERMKIATESGGIGLWSIELGEKKTVWDQVSYALFGEDENCNINPHEIWASRTHPEDVARIKQLMTKLAQGKRDYEFEYRIILPNQGVRYLRCVGKVSLNEQQKPVRILGIHWDITELRELSNKHAQEHELLRVTLMSIADAVITTDENNCIEWMNPVAERLTGWQVDEARKRNLLQVFHVVDERTRLPEKEPLTANDVKPNVLPKRSQKTLLSRNGEEFGITYSASPIRSNQGIVLGAVVVFHDESEQRRLNGEMNYRASHDSLTGLVNRSEFETRFKRLLNQSRRDESKHVLLYIDLDQFKLVNDACGHAVGDQLLKRVSRLLKDSIRKRDTLARLGGDEFGILLENCLPENAQSIAQQICDKMEEFRFSHDERRFRIGASIGLVPIDSRWVSDVAALQAADTACYAAKEAGRNRVYAWFDTDSTMRARKVEMQWATRIEKALDEDGFVLHGQRIESLQPGHGRLHLEVLIRMLDSDGNTIAPFAFLPAAERFQLASRIDRWVLRNSITWLQSLPYPCLVESMAINVSGQSMCDTTFHQSAVEILQGLAPDICRRICLEITETSVMTNLREAEIFIGKVRKLGVKVALDDFGAGASSFSYLKKLNVDVLKIDGHFIKQLIEDPLSEAAVRCFIDVAKLMNLETVAEFVDRQDVLEKITAMGVNYAQGFLMHKPEPLAKILEQITLSEEAGHNHSINYR